MTILKEPAIYSVSVSQEKVEELILDYVIKSNSGVTVPKVGVSYRFIMHRYASISYGDPTGAVVVSWKEE